MTQVVRILGIDPSLRACGWGVVQAEGLKLRHIAHGVIKPPATQSLAQRLDVLYGALEALIDTWSPHSAAVEEAFMKNNPMSALKLGHARAICLLAPSRAGLSVAEYSPRSVKKAVVGTGAADKAQVAAMMNVLLPGCGVQAGDASDALAIAICHAQNAHHSENVMIRARAS